MNFNMTPRVSIGLPVFNGEKYLAETIDSLLAQTLTDFELIISDNASTDATSNICREYVSKDPRIRYYRSDKNLGAAWNFNNTFYLSHGEYFKWAAHDDIHHPAFLEKCVEILDQIPSVVLCFSKTTFVDVDGQDLGDYEYPLDVSHASRRQLFLVYAGGGHIVHEIFGVIRAEVLRNTPLIGGYIGSDLVLLGKLALHGRFHQIPEHLFFHREHAERSTIATGGDRGYTQWFDASKSGRFVMPHWRRLFENAKTVIRQPMGNAEKIGCLLDLCRVVNWKRDIFWGEISRFMKVAWGSIR